MNYYYVESDVVKCPICGYMYIKDALHCNECNAVLDKKEDRWWCSRCFSYKEVENDGPDSEGIRRSL